MPAPAAQGNLHAFPVYDQIPRETVLSNLRLNLPEKIRKLQAYVVFKYTPARATGGKRGKLPHYVHSRLPRSGRHGSAADVSQMASFDAALELYRSDPSVSGIGICALPSNGLTFLDVDNCFDPATGEVNAIARELLAWGTYAEFSPGGRGLRLVVNGDLGLDNKNHTGGLEAFSHRGFITVTGLPFGEPKPLRTLSAEQSARLQELLHAAPRTGGEEELVNIPAPLTKERLRDVRKALHHIDPDLDYARWLAIGQALHSGAPDPQGTGFDLWVKWSQRGAKFADTSVEAMLDKWRGFHPGRGVTLATIFHIAKDYGYTHRSVAEPAAEGALDIEGHQDFDNLPDQDLDPLCPGLFDHVGAYMFIGRAKIGKSRVLGLMTASALVGGNVFGFSFRERCRVLVLALEERVQDIVERLRLYMVEPSEHKGQLVVIDHEMFGKAAKRYSEDYDYIQWLDAALAKYRPRFCYLDPLVNLRMTWMNTPDLRSKRITDEDYQMAAMLQELAVKHRCVLVFTVHGSKRKTHPQQAFDPFESVGTTSWTAAGCTGSLVIMDMPNHNPLEDEDEGQRVFSIRGRFRRKGDEHLLLQNARNHGTISALGPFRAVLLTQRQEELLSLIAEFAEEGAEWVTGRMLAQNVGCSVRNVRAILGRFARDNGLYQGRRLESSPHHGYRLVQ